MLELRRPRPSPVLASSSWSLLIISSTEGSALTTWLPLYAQQRDIRVKALIVCISCWVLKTPDPSIHSRCSIKILAKCAGDDSTYFGNHLRHKAYTACHLYAYLHLARSTCSKEVQAREAPAGKSALLKMRKVQCMRLSLGLTVQRLVQLILLPQPSLLPSDAF